MAIDRSKVRSAAKKHYRNKNWQKAIREYQKLAEDDASDLRSLLKIADLHDRLGHEDEAVDTYRQVGDKHAREDFYQKAVAAYKQGLQIQPDDGDLQRKVGEAYYRLDRLRDAVEAFQRAKQYYEDGGDDENYIEVLERLVDLHPKDVGLQIQLAESYAQQSRRHEALETFRAAADKLDEEGRVDDFLQVSKRILYFDPDDRDLRKHIIDLYLDRGDYKHALKHLHICFNNDPRDIDILRPLAETFLELDRLDKAVLVFHKLAHQHHEAERLQQARSIWNRILEIDGSNQKAQKLLEQTQSQVDASPRSRASSSSPRHSRAQTDNRPPDTAEADDGGDALEDIEFIDEASEAESTSHASEPPSTDSLERERAHTERHSNTTEEGDDEELLDISDNIVPVEADGGGAESSPSPETVSSSPDAPPPPESHRAETNEPPPSETSPPSSSPRPDELDSSSHDKKQAGDTGRDETDKGHEGLDEQLDEVDVLLKYGLHDKARDLLRDLASSHSDHPELYRRRRRLYADTDQTQAEVRTLVDMARLSDTTRAQAETWLQEALSIAEDSEPVAEAARELGVSLEGLEQPHASEPSTRPNAPDTPEHASNTSPVVDEDPPELIDPTTDSEIVEVESSGADYPSDELESVDSLGAADTDVDPEIGTDPGPPPHPDSPPASSKHDETQDHGEVQDENLESFEFVDTSLDDETPETSGEFDLDFLEEEADRALDDLFDDVQKDDDDQINIGTDDPAGEMADIDFYIQQKLYDEAEAALEEFERANPDHPGIDKRRYQIKMGRQGGKPEDNPSGAESLSQEFEAEPDVPDADASESSATSRPSSSSSPGSRSTQSQTEAKSSLELGDAYRDMGLYDDAVDEYQKALDEPDAAPRARYRMALCRQEQGETRAALDLLSALVDNSHASDELRRDAHNKIDDLESRLD